MAATRDESTGRFVSDVADELELFEVVKQVALIATKPGYDPRKVTMDDWDRTKEASIWAHFPDARDICRMLRPRGRKSYPWTKLLEDVFSGHSFERIQAERQSVADDLQIHGERIRYSLRRVAAFNGWETVSRLDYASGYDKLIADDKRHRMERAMLAERLLTVGQIDGFCGGDWNVATDLAGLPRAKGPTLVRRPQEEQQQVTEVRIVTSLREFAAAARSRGWKKLSKTNYEKLIREPEHRHWVSPSRLNELGPFDELLKGALDAEALELAQVADLVQLGEKQAAVEERRRRAKEGPDPTSAECQELLELLTREAQPMKTRELVEKLGVKQGQLVRRLNALLKAGLIAKAGNTHRTVYAALGVSLEVVAPAKRQRAMGKRIDGPDDPRCVEMLDLLIKRGSLTSAEVAAELKISVPTSNTRLAVLVEAERVEVTRGARGVRIYAPAAAFRLRAV